MRTEIIGAAYLEKLAWRNQAVMGGLGLAGIGAGTYTMKPIAREVAGLVGDVRSELKNKEDGIIPALYHGLADGGAAGGQAIGEHMAPYADRISQTAKDLGGSAQDVAKKWNQAMGMGVGGSIGLAGGLGAFMLHDRAQRRRDKEREQMRWYDYLGPAALAAGGLGGGYLAYRHFTK